MFSAQQVIEVPRGQITKMNIGNVEVCDKPLAQHHPNLNVKAMN